MIAFSDVLIETTYCNLTLISAQRELRQQECSQDASRQGAASRFCWHSLSALFRIAASAICGRCRHHNPCILAFSPAPLSRRRQRTERHPSSTQPQDLLLLGRSGCLFTRPSRLFEPDEAADCDCLDVPRGPDPTPSSLGGPRAVAAQQRHSAVIAYR